MQGGGQRFYSTGVSDVTERVGGDLAGSDVLILQRDNPGRGNAAIASVRQRNGCHITHLRMAVLQSKVEVFEYAPAFSLESERQRSLRPHLPGFVLQGGNQG